MITVLPIIPYFKNKFMIAMLGAAASCTLVTTAHAEYDPTSDPFVRDGFVQNDWQLVCDNTLTCRAAGYSKESAEWRASILMTLTADEMIPNTQVILNYWDAAEAVAAQLKAADYQVEMRLNEKSLGLVQLSQDESGIGTLSKLQTTELINHARRNTKITFKLANYEWLISDAGISAVLLKLDDIQGRTGNASALLSKNAPNALTPKQAQPVPEIDVADVYSNDLYDLGDVQNTPLTPNITIDSYPITHLQQTEWLTNMGQWVMPTLTSSSSNADDSGSARSTNDDSRESYGLEACNLLDPSNLLYDDYAKWTLDPIDPEHSIASHPCWSGAYNFGLGYWLINHSAPNQPTLITTDGSAYYEGQIMASHKSRGLGDCWWTKEWQWNGASFVKTAEQTTGLCRQISAGGAWELPTYVSKIMKLEESQVTVTGQ